MPKNGEKELSCLISVQRYLFAQEYDDVKGKIKQAKGLQDFDIDSMIDPKAKSHIYVSPKELVDLTYILSSVQPNANWNKFPDFEYEDSFVEHFQVTSSKENRGGSDYLEFLGNFNKQCSKLAPSDRVVRHYEAEKHTISNLQESIRNHLETHIFKLEKANKSYNNGVFLIEFADNSLVVGDKEQFNEAYLLSRDPVALDSIYNLLKVLPMNTYVIFSTKRTAELISTKGIPELISSVSEKKEVKGTGVTAIGICENISEISFGTCPSVAPFEEDLTIM